MRELRLRLMTRIATMKRWPFSLTVVIPIIIALFIGNSLRISLSKPWWSEPVTVAQLARAQEPIPYYVEVSGTAYYQKAYKDVYEDGKNLGTVIGYYYLLVDRKAEAVVIVKARDGARVQNEDVGPVTIKGMTRYTYDHVAKGVADDLSELCELGWSCNSRLYVSDGSKPDNPLVLLLVGGTLLTFAGLRVLSRFLPEVTFVNSPLPPAKRSRLNSTNVYLTGSLFHVDQVDPLVLGGQRKTFKQHGVTSIKTLPGREMALLVRDIFSTEQAIGIAKSYWGIVLSPWQIKGTEIGKLYYGWRGEYPALLLRYEPEGGKQDQLIVSFASLARLQEFAEQLQHHGIHVDLSASGAWGTVPLYYA